MTFRPALLALLAAALISVAYPLRAQTTKGTEAAEPTALATSFTLIVLGTRHYSDVNVVISNLKNLPYVDRIVPTLTTQMRQEFEGSFQRKEGDLVADVRSLAADRFDLETRADDPSGLVITLRKIGSPQDMP
jgi:hypothetical protein